MWNSTSENTTEQPILATLSIGGSRWCTDAVCVFIRVLKLMWMRDALRVFAVN